MERLPRKWIPAAGKLVLSILLSVGLLWILLREIELETVVAIFATIPLQAVVVGFVLYVLVNALRALRMRVVFREVRYQRLLGVALVHNFWNNLIPLRIGEFSFLWLMRKHTHTNRSLMALIVFRFLDFAVIALLFLTGILLITGEGVSLYGYGLICLVVSLVPGLMLLLLSRLPDRWAPGPVGKLRQELRQYTPRQLFGALGYTVVLWVVSLVLFYVLCEPMDMVVTFVQLWIPISLVRLSNILPVSGLAGFGTTEGAWAIGLYAVGVDFESAVASGLLVHLIRLAYTLVLGGVGGLLLRTSRNS